MWQSPVRQRGGNANGRKNQSKKRSWKRAQVSEGEFGWRPFFREKVVATVVESGNLGEEIDVWRAKFEVTISFASPQPWEKSTDFLCFWSEVGIFLLQKMVLGESGAGCPAMLGPFGQPRALKSPSSKDRSEICCLHHRRGASRFSSFLGRRGLGMRRGLPVYSPHRNHTGVSQFLPSLFHWHVCQRWPCRCLCFGQHFLCLTRIFWDGLVLKSLASFPSKAIIWIICKVVALFKDLRRVVLRKYC